MILALSNLSSASRRGEMMRMQDVTCLLELVFCPLPSRSGGEGDGSEYHAEGNGVPERYRAFHFSSF